MIYDRVNIRFASLGAGCCLSRLSKCGDLGIDYANKIS